MNRGLLAALCIAALCITGCSKGGGAAATPDPGQIRVVNLIPTSPALQASLTGSQLATVSYGQASPMTTKPENSAYDLLVSYTDPALGNTVTVKENSTFDLASNKAYTVVATGSLDSATLTTIENDKIGDIVTGNTEIQFFNGNTSVGAVDIYLSDTPTSNSINGITPVSLDVNGFSKISTESSGDYRILVTKKGSNTIIYDSGKVTLDSQTRRLFAVDDYFGPGGSIRVMEITPQASSTLINEQFPTAIRVANMIPDLGSVDVLMNGTPLFSNLAFGAVSTYTVFAAGLDDFQVTLAGDPTSVIYDNSHQTIPGENRTLVITGSGLTPNVVGRFILDDQRRIATGAQMRVINASPGAGNLDVYFLVPGQDLTTAFNDNESTFSNFTLLTNGATLLQAGQYDATFTRTATDTIVVGPDRVSVADSGIYSIFVKDAPGGGTPADVTLADDFTK